LTHILLDFLSIGVKLGTSKFTTLINIINETLVLDLDSTSSIRLYKGYALEK